VSRFDRPRFLVAIAPLVFVFLYAPIAVVVLFSFNRERSLQVLNGFSLRWYEDFLQDDSLRESLFASIEIAAMRPEKLLVDELEDGMATVEGTIAERVYMGTATQLIVELGPGARVVALEQNTARARSDDRWELSDRVRIGWRPEHGQILR
jgi:hypothetical protein